MTAASNTLEKAVGHHKEGRLEQAEVLYREVLRVDSRHADALHLLGVVSHQRRQNTEAVDYISRAIGINSNRAWYHRNLGSALQALGKFESAVDSFREALRLDPQFAEAHYHLGTALLRLDRTGEAIAALRDSVRYNPNFAQAHDSLGSALLVSGQAEQAIASYLRAAAIDADNVGYQINLSLAYRQKEDFEQSLACLGRAVTLEPNRIETYRLMGIISTRAGKPRAAMAAYRRALEIDPNHHQLHLEVAGFYKEEQRWDDAIASYQHALHLVPEDVGILYDLGNLLVGLRRHDEAGDCFQRVLEIKPGDQAAIISLGNIFKHQDRIDEAVKCYRTVSRGAADQTRWRLWTASMCPVIFSSSAEIDEYRSRLLEEYERIAETDFSLSPAEVSSAGCPPPYNLQFHGRDNRPLKEAHARLFRHFTTLDEPSRRTGKPRIGFVATQGHGGAFLRFMKRIVTGMDAHQFDRTIVCPKPAIETLAAHLADKSIQYLSIAPEFDQTLERIREARFDVLYYWEIGSNIENTFLPMFRLAPIQCTAGGLPDTSGISEVDYFLSTDIVEAPDAEAHYTERLIRADSFLTCQERMSFPAVPKTRESFGFPTDQSLYLCPHKIHKFHPDFDGLLADILRHDRRGVIAIPEDERGYLARKLKTRFEATFPDVSQRILFIPYLSLSDYLSLTAAADAILDPLYYGGGLTAYDGLSLNQPIVTLPTQFVRGRYTSGFYQTMGVTECVAETRAEYVQIAVRLANDGDFRHTVVEKIEERSDILFDNTRAVAEHAAIFERLVDEARSG